MGIRPITHTKKSHAFVYKTGTSSLIAMKHQTKQNENKTATKVCNSIKFFAKYTENYISVCERVHESSLFGIANVGTHIWWGLQKKWCEISMAWTTTTTTKSIQRKMHSTKAAQQQQQKNSSHSHEIDRISSTYELFQSLKLSRS